jgi:hypothetical protein
LLRGTETKSLRPPPQVCFWADLPKVSSGIASLLSPEAVQKSIIERFVKYVHEYGPGVEAKIVKLCPSDNDARLDFLAVDHPMHSFYQSLLNPAKEKVVERSEEVMADRRRRAIALLKASGIISGPSNTTTTETTQVVTEGKAENVNYISSGEIGENN